MAKVTIDNTFTPLVHNPENVLEVNQLKKYFPIKEGLLQRTRSANPAAARPPSAAPSCA